MAPSTDQRLHALEVEARELALRFGRGELRLLLARVELDEHVSLPDRPARLERDAATRPGRSALTVTPCTARSYR